MSLDIVILVKLINLLHLQATVALRSLSLIRYEFGQLTNCRVFEIPRPVWEKVKGSPEVESALRGAK